MFRSVRRVRIVALLVLGTLAVILSVEYLLLRPVAGMGASFDSPQQAIIEAFGPTGWLGDVAQLTLYDQAVTAEGYVFVYAGFPPNNQISNMQPSIFGIADAKPSWRGWYAHGMMAVQQPPQLPDTNVLSCTTAQRPASGQQFFVLAGYVRQPNVTYVEIEFASGRTKRATVHNATFAVLTTAEQEVTRLQAINQQGDVLQTIVGETCT